MYLVDTSVWVDFVRGRHEPHVSLLRDLLGNPLAVSITHLVYMEILQGARDPASYVRLQDYFSGQRFVGSSTRLPDTRPQPGCISTVGDAA